MHERPLDPQALPLLLEREPREPGGLADLLALLRRERPRLTALLQRHGGLLLRGYAVAGAADFERVAEAFAGPLSAYVGGDSPRKRVEGRVYNASDFPAAMEIPPHNEKSYAPDYPRLVLFHCEVAAPVGGATPLVDGRRLLTRLAPDTVEAFRHRGVTYIQNLPDGRAPAAQRTWQEAFETEDRAQAEAALRRQGAQYRWLDDGGLFMAQTMPAVVVHPDSGEAAFFSQADQWHLSRLPPEWQGDGDEYDLYHAARFGDGTPLDAAQLDEVRAAMQAGKVSFRWQAGDVLILDNLLTLHGRAPFEGPRRVLVALA